MSPPNSSSSALGRGSPFPLRFGVCFGLPKSESVESCNQKCHCSTVWGGGIMVNVWVKAGSKAAHHRVYSVWGKCRTCAGCSRLSSVFCLWTDHFQSLNTDGLHRAGGKYILKALESGERFFSSLQSSPEILIRCCAYAWFIETKVKPAFSQQRKPSHWNTD